MTKVAFLKFLVVLVLELLFHGRQAIAATNDPECIHWYAPVSLSSDAPFFTKAIVRPQAVGKGYLRKPHPHFCLDSALSDTPACNEKTYAQVNYGDRVTISFSCGQWSWVDFKSKLCKTPNWVSRTKDACNYSGWMHTDDLVPIAITPEELRIRQASAAELHSTPLLKAIYQGDKRRAVDVTQSMPALEAAGALVQGILNNQIDVINAAVARGATLDKNELNACSAVVSAASASPEVLDAILQLGGNINCRRFQGVTPLIGLAMSDSSKNEYWEARGRPVVHRSSPVEMIGFTVGRGSDLEARNDFGQTALEVSIRENNVAIAQALISHGANPRVINSWNPAQSGITLVMAAFAPFYLAKDPSMLKLALASGADPNVLNPGPYNRMCVQTSCPWSGQTALTRAIHDGSAELVKLLLLYGANPRIKRADGMLPYDLAVKLNKADIAALLKTEMNK